jgi:hypothetical protein
MPGGKGFCPIEICSLSTSRRSRKSSGPSCRGWPSVVAWAVISLSLPPSSAGILGILGVAHLDGEGAPDQYHTEAEYISQAKPSSAKTSNPEGQYQLTKATIYSNNLATPSAPATAHRRLQLNSYLCLLTFENEIREAVVKNPCGAISGS